MIRPPTLDVVLLNHGQDVAPKLSHLAVVLLDHFCSARKIERARRLFEILIGLMKQEYLERFKAWSNEEIETLKAKGATEDDLKEPAFNSLVVESVLEEHRD